MAPRTLPRPITSNTISTWHDGSTAPEIDGSSTAGLIWDGPRQIPRVVGGNLQMRRIILVTLIAFAVSVVSSCANKNAGSNSDRPHATIQMRDGSTMTGVITAT